MDRRTLRAGSGDRVISRRAFIAGSIALGAVPRSSAAQSAGTVWRLAYLNVSDGPTMVDAAFDGTMKELGYVEGYNIVLERRYAAGKRPEALDEIVQDVLRLRIDLIFAWAAPWTFAAKRATTTIPIVFGGVRGPVERGIVPSLAHPGANVTGISTYPVETMDPKLFEIARELVPRVSRVAVLRSAVDPPGARERQDAAARTLKLELVPIPFSDERDLASVPTALDRSGAQLLIAPDTPLLLVHRKDIINLAAKKRLPVVYAFNEAVEDGGLIGLGNDFVESARRGARYVDKILKGAKPGDLPVEQPTKVRFSVNMKTAKVLGLTIPQSLLLRADEVIQ